MGTMKALQFLGGNENDVTVKICYLVSNRNDVTVTVCGNDAHLWLYCNLFVLNINQRSRSCIYLYRYSFAGGSATPYSIIWTMHNRL
jgi:hypothetical protein